MIACGGAVAAGAEVGEWDVAGPLTVGVEVCGQRPAHDLRDGGIVAARLKPKQGAHSVWKAQCCALHTHIIAYDLPYHLGAARPRGRWELARQVDEGARAEPGQCTVAPPAGHQSRAECSSRRRVFVFGRGRIGSWLPPFEGVPGAHSQLSQKMVQKRVLSQRAGGRAAAILAVAHIPGSPTPSAAFRS